MPWIKEKMPDENARNCTSTHFPVLKSMKPKSKKLNDSGGTTKNALDIPIQVDNMEN